MADITPATRAAVLWRASGRCEWCGQGAQSLDLHHRLYRSRRYRLDGGDLHGGDNLVALCGWGNHTGCHGRAHGAAPGDYEAAVAAGITIPSGGSPAAIPIRSVWFGFHVLLLPDGSPIPADTVPTIPERETAADPKVDRRHGPHTNGTESDAT